MPGTGTVPSETCDHHALLNICSETGLIANANCPAHLVVPRVFIIGGDPETSDNAFIATEEFLATICPHVPAPPPEPEPEEPTEPTDPTDPTEPTDPTDPTEPTDPTNPTGHFFNLD